MNEEYINKVLAANYALSKHTDLLRGAIPVFRAMLRKTILEGFEVPEGTVRAVFVTVPDADIAIVMAALEAAKEEREKALRKVSNDSVNG